MVEPLTNRFPAASTATPVASSHWAPPSRVVTAGCGWAAARVAEAAGVATGAGSVAPGLPRIRASAAATTANRTSDGSPPPAARRSPALRRGSSRRRARGCLPIMASWWGRGSGDADRDPLDAVLGVALEVPERLERLDVAGGVGGPHREDVLTGSGPPGVPPRRPGVR